MSDYWLYGILPSYWQKDSVESEYISIVPPTDSRVIEIVNETPNIKYLLDGFSDQFQRKIFPSAIIVKKDSPSSIQNDEAIISFRNIVAMSYIVKNWQDFLNYKSPFSFFRFSDYFNIYPITIDKTGSKFVINSPCVLGIDEPQEFHGQPSPELASVQMAIMYDNALFNLLLSAWTSAYSKKQIAKWRYRVLFRSLEMAFHATSIPVKNSSSIYDYGASISLWVSSIEILLHDRERINLPKVLEKIEAFEWWAPENRRKKYKIKLGKKEKTKLCTFPQKIYYEMYKARCKFFHGEPVKLRDLMLFKSKRCYSLNCYAPLLYKAIIHSFLKKKNNSKSSKSIVANRLKFWGFEDALINGKYRNSNNDDNL